MQFDSNVKQFMLGEEGLLAIRKQTIRRLVPLMFFASTVVLVIGFANAKKEYDASVLLLTVAMMAVAFGVSLYRTLRKQKALLQTYCLTITDTMIGREQKNTPAVAIPLQQVRSIEKKRRGDFVVRGQKRHDVICIPAQIDNYQELEKTLNGFKPLATGTTETVWKKMQFLLPLLTIGSMICVYTVNNKILVAGSGVLLLALFGWSLHEGQKSRNIDRKTKRSMWWVVLVALSVMVVVMTKLMS